MQLTHNVYRTTRSPSLIKRVWRSYKQNASALFALWSLGLFILVTLFSPWLAPFNPSFQTGEILLPPSWYSIGHVEYFLGTDDLSRDMLSRLIAGARATFGLALVITFCSGLIGIVVGMLMGISEGPLARFVSQLLDAAIAIPSLLVAIIFVALFGNDGIHLFWALLIALVLRFIRSTYSAVFDEMQKEYILSSRLDGANNLELLWHAILPNIVASLASSFTRAISSTILDIAALGFLGFSISNSACEWGSMVNEAIEYVLVAPWTVILPCSAIMFTVLSVNLFGDNITRAISTGTE